MSRGGALIPIGPFGVCVFLLFFIECMLTSVGSQKRGAFLFYLPGVSLSCAAAPGTYTERGSLESKEGQRKACRFSKSLLGSCSGDDDATFGFSKGKPCIIVKLNRIVNYRPRVGLSWLCCPYGTGVPHTVWFVYMFGFDVT